MSSEMLSNALLTFKDQDLLEIYQREKVDFYSRAMPIITVMMLLLTGTLEIAYRF